MSEQDIVIGIDLGTTNSCAAVYSEGHVRVLENNEGHRITPSYIYFNEQNAVTVGHYAKRMAERYKPEYGIYEIKRLIGRQFDDPKVQNNLHYLPYIVESSSDTKEPVVVVEQPEEDIIKTPVELCSLILSKIKIDVEKKIDNWKATKAVITVPAYFNMAQREATLDAAKRAGFTVLKLLNEPTAAAYKYLEKERATDGYFLVYDLGGGTFDVAILKRTATCVEVVGVDGDSHLGGHDFDNCILDFAIKILAEQYEFDAKFSQDKRSLLRLRNACEEAKKELSDLPTTDIILDGFMPNEQIKVEITRRQFEDLADSLFKKTIEIVNNCLNSCDLSKENIEKVILSGGSTRIPKIQELVKDYFGDERVSLFLHPDECVAEGAAIQAAMFSKNTNQKIDVFKIIDVTPLSLGINDFVNRMYFDIKRNTPIPASITTRRITYQNEQNHIRFKIYEGERTDVRKNRLLGELCLTNLTPAPPGQCRAFITLNIDQNGILTVTAKEQYKENIKDLKIEYNRGNRSDAEVKNAVKDAEDNKDEDKLFLKLANLKEYLLKYCERVKYNIANKNLSETHEEIFTLCSAIQLAEADSSEIELREQIELIESKCHSLVNEHNFELMPKKKFN